MKTNFLTSGLRALRRQKVHVLINVTGLAVGLACSLVIALFVFHQLGFDREHEHKDRIYRVGLQGRISGQAMRVAYTSPPVGPAMGNEFPEVERFLRLNVWSETIVQYEDLALAESHFVEADSTFFDFFSFPLLRGDKNTALSEPYSLVLTERAAESLFGTEDPLDRMMRVGSSDTPYRVTGVMQDIPENSHLLINMLGSYVTNPGSQSQNWMSNSLQTYVMLHPEACPEQVSERFEPLIVKYVGPLVRQFLGITLEDFIRQGNTYTYFLQPLRSLHLDPSVEAPFRPASDPRYLWIFGGVGLLILVIASINFMNLATAQATKRAKEVGVKKACGSSRGMLVRQFLGESLSLAFAALILAFILVELILGQLNTLLSTSLSLGFYMHPVRLPLLLVFTALIGLLAGLYPAFYLSSFRAAEVLKGKTGQSRQSLRLRRVLTVVQFLISIALISSTTIMYRQLHFLLNKDLGFDKEHVVVIRRAGVLGGRVHSFKNELQAIPGVLSVSASTAVPGRTNNTNTYIILGREEESYVFQTVWADYDYLETFRIGMASGRYFDPDLLTDRQACIINERAVREFQLEDPFSTRILFGNPADPEVERMPVIGLMKDYHLESVRADIMPQIIRFKNDDMQWGYVSIRLAEQAPAGIMEQIEAVWSSFVPQDPLLSFYLDEDYNRLLREEQQSARMSVWFTVLAILIAALGLYGLTAFNVQQRTREIGVRKIFGASVSGICLMVIWEIIRLVALATVLAWPLVYWAASTWLQNYPFRVELTAADFLIGLFLAVVVSLLTVTLTVVRAARAQPVEALRYE